jgi:hypothetical protein
MSKAGGFKRARKMLLLLKAAIHEELGREKSETATGVTVLSIPCGTFTFLSQQPQTFTHFPPNFAISSTDFARLHNLHPAHSSFLAASTERLPGFEKFPPESSYEFAYFDARTKLH